MAALSCYGILRKGLNRISFFIGCMKKAVLLLILMFFLSSCVPEPEELAGVTREELMTGKAVEKVLQKTNEKNVVDESIKQTLAQAHEKEAVDIAEHAWDELREEAPRVLDDGAIQAGVGEKFTVNVE